MNYNVHNGGLAFKTNNMLLLTDLKAYSGTYALDGDNSAPVRIDDGMFWFMNEDSGTIYYSDQTQGNRLYQWNLSAQEGERLLDRPVYGVTRHGEWLYYLNETDNKLFRCNLAGKQETRITDEPAEAFVLDDHQIYYTTQQGIRTCSVTGRDRELVSEELAVHLIKIGNQLAFADKRNHYALTILDLGTGEKQVFEDITPNSLNSDGRYLYCANRSNDSTIYRIDPVTNGKIRICGESAEYVHILDDEIFFCSNREWFRMSLSGGQAVRALQYRESEG